MEDNLHNVMTSIKDAVLDSIENIDRVAVMFSGGLDSSLLAYIAKDHQKRTDITLYTVGTPDSWDIRNAEPTAILLGLNLKKILINSRDITSSIPAVSRIIESQHPVKLSFQLPLYLGMAKVSEKHVLSGQGADELFGGYSRYLDMTENELKVALKNDYDVLISRDIEMDRKVARHFNRKLITPYLDDNVVKSAQKVPIDYKVSNGYRKVILKEAALALGLPKNLANKEKKAIQYSAGIIKELKKMAREEDMEVRELLEGIISENTE